MQETEMRPMSDRMKIEKMGDEIKIGVRVGDTNSWNFQIYPTDVAKNIMDEIREWLIEERYL